MIQIVISTSLLLELGLGSTGTETGDEGTVVLVASPKYASFSDEVFVF
jgi:hypothetical protein